MEKLLDMKYGEDMVEDVVTEESDVMEFVVEHKVIMKALSLCAKIVPRSAAIPILQMINFNLKGDTLFITAMDTAQSVLQMIEIENKGQVDGDFLFPAKEGIDLVKRLPHGSLSLVKKDSTLYISWGKGEANLKVLSSDEYPPLPILDASNIISAPIGVLRKGAIGANFSLSDETVPSLSGIYIYNEGGKLSFVATDRHRIYRYVSDILILDQESFIGGIIPASNFKQIVESLNSQELDILLSDSYLILKDKKTVYFGRLIDAKYPDLSKIFSMIDRGVQVSFPRSEMSDALNRALSLDAVNNRVTLDVNDSGEFILHTRSDNSELCEVFPDVKVGDDFPVMKFNGKFILDALLASEAKNVTLHVSGSRMPGFLTMEEDPSLTVVINPIM